MMIKLHNWLRGNLNHFKIALEEVANAKEEQDIFNITLKIARKETYRTKIPGSNNLNCETCL